MEHGLTVGQYLQKQREEKKVPLEDVASVTRITLANLQALERDEFYRLPAETFARGFLRAYAKSLDLDPVQIIDLYKRQTEEEKNQIQERELAARPSPSFLKNILNLFFGFIATLAGASPSFSSGKVILPPKN
ncbi:MAG: helix-turn-helix domain-containing protein [Deltaproteobacteria bacterium]|nr:helix-turn-helix domain-containing protein [Deltaproteobacteria bacterium]